MDADAEPTSDDRDDATPEAPRAEGRPGGDGEVRLELPVSRSRAFDAYVRDFGSWWQHGRTHRADLHVEQEAGGAIVEHAPGGDESRWGDVHEIEVGTRIRHSYRHQGDGEPIVTAEFEDGEHGGTVMRLRHEAWTGSEEQRDALQDSWTTALRRFVDDATSV